MKGARKALHGRLLATGEAVSVHLQGERVAAVETDDNPSPDENAWIAPGLVDLQLNGCGGDDFNESPLPTARLGHVARRLCAQGVTRFLPTLITAGADDLEHRLKAIATAMRTDPFAAACVPGIHLEGPFISPQDGPRGAHPAAHVRPPDWALFERLQEAADGAIRIVTLSPEWPEAPVFIERCVERGVIVSIGHTAASPRQVRDAVTAGARLSTHLGNGAHATLPRHPNYVWEQLADDRLCACLIADGFHLPDAVLRVMLRAKAGRAVIVSDAVALQGQPPGAYTVPGMGEVVLTEAGRLHLAASPALLAGSAQLLPWNVERLAGRQLTTLREAWEMASTRPAELMGLPEARGLRPGGPADVVRFTWDGCSLHLLDVYKAGERVAGD